MGETSALVTRGVLAVVRRALRKLGYSIVLLKVGGLECFFQQLRRQIYSRDTYIGWEADLDTDFIPVPRRLKYTVRLATEEDMEEVLQQSKSEGKQSTYELLQRKLFYESGFRNCYGARTADAGELCYMEWVIYPEDDNTASQAYRSRFPKLKENEILLENAYTFKKYRGNWLDASVTTEVLEMVRQNGFKRVILYVQQDNIASMKSQERQGFRRFEEVPELRRFFFTRRKHSQGFLNE